MSETIRDVIRDHLAQTGMRQVDLARKIGVTPSAVSRWLSGDRLTDRHLRALAAELDRPVDELRSMRYAEQDERRPTPTIAELIARIEALEAERPTGDDKPSPAPRSGRRRRPAGPPRP